MNRIVIKFVHASELPALCGGCGRFIDELCVDFPATYDLDEEGYLCKACASLLLPSISNALGIICTGVLHAYYEATNSLEAGEQLRLLRMGCAELLNSHFAGVFGQPEPDYYLTTQIEQ